MVGGPAQREQLSGFLSGLFGWRIPVGAPEVGYYSRAQLGDDEVMGLGQQDGADGTWVSYLATDDIERDVARAQASGASVGFGPHHVMDLGVTAVGRDPQGAVFGFWQPGSFTGFGVTGAVGSFTWFDHGSPDPEAAARFYADSFGLDVVRAEDHFVLSCAGTAFASTSYTDGSNGITWWPILRVASMPASARCAESLGAGLIADNIAVPGGRLAIVAEPVCNSKVFLLEEDPGGSEG